jgi:hypothetical protein
VNYTAAAFDELAQVLRKWAEDGRPVIKPKLDCRGIGTGVRWWRVQLVEESDDEGNWYNQRLNDFTERAAEQLKDWPDVKRMAFDMWDFKYRKDAEKFITLFHLSWQQ